MMIEEYRRHLVRSGYSAETVEHYTGMVRQLATWSGKPVESLTVDDAAAFLARPGLSQSSRHTYHRWLSAWDRWRRGAGGLVDGVRRGAAPGHRPRPASVDQVAAMLDACRDEEETALLLLLYTSGLRRAEAARFRGDQLDVASRRVVVRCGKGGRDTDAPATPALLRHAAVMPARGWWFPSPVNAGQPIGPHAVWARLTRISARSGLGHVPPHRLRHAYATELVRAGVPLTTVSRCMRHSSVASTAMYVGVTPQEEWEAACAIPLSR